MNSALSRRQVFLGAGAAFAQAASAQTITQSGRPSSRPRFSQDTEAIRARLGISLTYFYYNYSHLAMVPRVMYSILERVRSAGISIVDISDYGSETMYAPFSSAQPDTIRALAKQCREVGLRIHSIHSTLGANPRPPLYAQLDIAKREIDLLLESGGQLWLTHLTADKGVENPQNRNAIEHLIKTYEKTSLLLTLENTKGPQDVAEVVAFANKVDHPKFGVTIDVGHCTKPYTPEERAKGSHPMCDPGRPREIIKMAANRLNHLHLHDFYRSSKSGKWEDHHVPFLGKLQWLELFDALEEVNYSGELLFETTELYEDTAVESVGMFPEMLQVVRDRQRSKTG